jgi:hypothetical protein
MAVRAGGALAAMLAADVIAAAGGWALTGRRVRASEPDRRRRDQRDRSGSYPTEGVCSP